MARSGRAEHRRELGRGHHHHGRRRHDDHHGLIVAPPRSARLAPFTPPGAGVLIASDFDGTLAPIVADPDAAAPVEGAVELLERLLATPAEIAVVSGRPLSFLTAQLPARLTFVGLYGLETQRRGVRVDHPEAGRWRPVVRDAADAVRRRGPEGMRVELKDLSITLHYREHPASADDVAATARAVAADAGLHVRPAKMSVELHPPIDEDKGTAIERLAGNSPGAVMYLGDDVGDHPAFDALDRLAAAGRPVLRVVAVSDEVDPSLEARADVAVDGPAGVRDLLASLLD